MSQRFSVGPGCIATKALLMGECGRYQSVIGLLCRFLLPLVAWEELRCKRDHGSDPALESRQTKKAKADNKKDKDVEQAYTVQVLCDEYLEGYIDRNRGEKSRCNTRSTSRVNCPYARFIGHATCCF